MMPTSNQHCHLFWLDLWTFALVMTISIWLTDSYKWSTEDARKWRECTFFTSNPTSQMHSFDIQNTGVRHSLWSRWIPRWPWYCSKNVSLIKTCKWLRGGDWRDRVGSSSCYDLFRRKANKEWTGLFLAKRNWTTYVHAFFGSDFMDEKHTRERTKPRFNQFYFVPEKCPSSYGTSMPRSHFSHCSAKFYLQKHGKNSSGRMLV